MFVDVLEELLVGEVRRRLLYEPSAKVIDLKKYKLPCNVYVVIKYNELQDEFFQNKENPEAIKA